MITRSWVAAVFAAFLMLGPHASAARADMLLGITIDNRLISINPATAQARVIGNLSSNMQAFDIAITGNKVYAWDQVANRIRQIDPTNAATLATINIQRAMAGEGAIEFDSRGIGYMISGNSGNPFVQFDITVPNSGVINRVFDFRPPMDGLAFDRAGTLYGMTNPSDIGNRLFTINPTTGQATLVANIATGAGIIGRDYLTGGLAFSADGDLYAVTANAMVSELYRVNKTTGAATFVGNIVDAANNRNIPRVSGIRFLVPEPGTAMLLGQTVALLGGAAWLRRSRPRGVTRSLS